MAGAGYKLFNTGDVLTAAQVNTYLQEQAVMRFANATARTTALSGVLAEGMMSYLDDTNSVEVYNGSAWVSVGSTGDITAVTTAANSGLTGGATSGDVALRINTTAKGSIIAGTGASTLGELTVGTNNFKLIADSTTSTGLAYQGFIGAFCRKNASQTLTTSTLGAITWQTEVFDTNNIHSTSSNTDRFTIPTGLGGYWFISASITFDASTSGGRRLYLFKNGSGGTSIATLRTGAFTGNYLNLQCTAIVSCVAGDYLSISGWQDTGGNLDVWGDNLGNDVSWISVAYLGA